MQINLPRLQNDPTHTRATRNTYIQKVEPIISILTEDTIQHLRSLKYQFLITVFELETEVERRFTHLLESSLQTARFRLNQISFGLINTAYRQGTTAADRSLARANIIPQAEIGGITLQDTRMIEKLKNLIDLSLVKSIPDKFFNFAKKILAAGVVLSGISIEQMISQISNLGSITINESKRIVNTEIIRTYNTALKEKIVRNGVTEWQWLTSKLESVCPICKPLHGKIFRIGEVIGHFRGQPFTQPPAHPNGVCGMRGVVKIRRVKGRFAKTVRPEGVAALASYR